MTMLMFGIKKSKLKILPVLFCGLFAFGNAFAGECDNWRADRPDWLHCDDFETSHDLHDYYYDVETNGLSIAADDPMIGAYSLKQHYVAGQVEAGWIAWSYCDTLGYDWAARTGDPKRGCHDEIYMRWYHKFEPGFSPSFPPKMGRITSIGPGWDKRFGVYYWIDGSVCDYCIVADVSTANGWIPIIETGFSYSNVLNVGRWTEHEMYVKKNSSASASDGAYTYWIDGEVAANRSNVNLANDYNFNNAMLDCYWNGGSPKEQNRYYDNFVISTSYIGPMQCENGENIVYPCYCGGSLSHTDGSNVHISGYCCNGSWQSEVCSGEDTTSPASPSGLSVN